MLRFFVVPIAYVALMVGEVAAVVLAVVDDWFGMANAGVFAAGGVVPLSVPVLTGFGIMVSVGCAAWRAWKKSWSWVRSLPDKGGLVLLLGSGGLTLFAISMAGLCTKLGGCGVDMEVVLVVLGISCSLLCGEGMRSMQRSGLWSSLVCGAVMVLGWGWFSLMEPGYVEMFADAGTVVVVMGSVILASSVGVLRNVGGAMRA